MAKIETITLKNVEIIETVNGEFEQNIISEQRMPASITNYSLSMGEKLGLIEPSEITDLNDVQTLFNSAVDGEIDEQEALKSIDITKFLKVIYLAIIGVNPQSKLTYDEFTQLYVEDTFTIIQTYTNLVLSTLAEGTNRFAEGMKRSTKKKNQKTK